MNDPKADYHVVIQDDAIICDNFREIAERTISRDEKYAYSFYYGRRQENREQAKIGLKNGFIISNWLSWGVAICLPTKIIPQMIEFCDRYTIKNDDSRIAGFLKFHGIKIFYPMPSLVDHRADEKSLVGDPGHRQAWFFIDNKKE